MSKTKAKDYSFVGLDMWGKDATAASVKVFGRALHLTLESIPVVPGIAKGGSRIRGTIPYDRRKLAKSLRSSNGRQTKVGETSYIAICRGIKPGDHITFRWGTVKGNYARLIHDGGNGLPGTHWTTVMLQRFPQYMKQAIAEAAGERP